MYNYYEILELLNEEFLASVIDTELLIINKIKYYNSSFFRKNLKLSKLDDKIEYIKYPFIYSGLYSNTDKVIIIFLNNCKNSISLSKNKFTKFDLANILRVLYHEVIHYNQKNYKSINLDTTAFIYEMEEILTDYNKKMYKKRHDDFYIEIEANVKAINKLIRFIDLNNINDDQVSKKLEKLKEKYLNNLLNYKFNAFFQEFIKCCDEYKLYTNNKYRIVNLFYNQNGEYKSIVDILNDKNFKNLDFEMKVLILYNIILDKDELKIKTKRRR